MAELVLRVVAFFWLGVGAFLAFEMEDSFGKPKQSIWVKITGSVIVLFAWPILGAISVWVDCRNEKRRKSR